MNEFVSANGETLYYVGNPNLEILEKLADSAGDLWHSGQDAGYANLFPELIYQTATFWWFLNDFTNLDKSISWRVPHNAFVVRKSLWDILQGFDEDYQTKTMKGIDLGYRALRESNAVPIYIKGLFERNEEKVDVISNFDRYLFYRKHFKKEHSLYMLFRKGFWKPFEIVTFWKVQKFKPNQTATFPVKELNPLVGSPSVSYVIPTMLRQDFTLQLLNALSNQSYPPAQVVIVDATPEDKRALSIYDKKFPFDLVVQYQTSKGSCRARNEAIQVCTGDYIVFGDDDIIIPSDFIENHIRFLQTYKVDACNGLDIRADHPNQRMEDLNEKLETLGKNRWKSGATASFSNANSCVKREWITKLVGNDVNFDGGYGEDSDFGLRLIKNGVIVMHNPFSVNLHLKPAIGGYRWWGSQAKIVGKKRKKQPWELDNPVGWLRPVPSPTVLYGIYKHFPVNQVMEYRSKYFFLYLFKGAKATIFIRLLKLPYRMLQFKKAQGYAKKLIEIGPRYS